MSGIIVKICGVRTVHHARVAAEAGADMVGLVFAASRRRVTVAEAREITSAAYARRPRFVGVFVNEPPEVIERMAAEAQLDVVQLSGNESPSDCASLAWPHMKAIHVSPDMSAGDILHITTRHQAATAILLDATSKSAPWGGSGYTVDFTLASEVVQRSPLPIIFAGGLCPDTVGHAIRAVRPAGVDVSSGVETDGAKDDRKIAAFIAAAREVT